MWQPKSIKEFENAVTSGLLEERHDFDAKRQLPESGKELAKDIAAMTTDGGCLVCTGSARTTTVSPVSLRLSDLLTPRSASIK
jgi:hypothetical protein